MTVILMSAFQWTMEVVWLWIVGGPIGYEYNVFRRLVFGKVDKNRNLD